MATSIDINGFKFKITRKKEYDVYICRPRIGSRVYNKLEGANYVTTQKRQFVVSGTVGENWVIDVGTLIRTYKFLNGDRITVEKLQKRLVAGGIIDWMHLSTLVNPGEDFFAANIPLSIRDFPVQTSWGDVLLANRVGVQHGCGDFIACSILNGQPNLNDLRVINGLVFPATYDMRAFPNMQIVTMYKGTPVPNSIIRK